MGTPKDWRDKNLETLRALIENYPCEVPHFEQESFNLPADLAANWKAFNPSDDEYLKFARIPLSIYKFYGDALGAAVELNKALKSEHVLSASALSRKIFESLVCVVYILTSRNKMLEHANRVSEIPVDEYSQYLEYVEKHPQSLFARQVAFRCHGTAKSEWTAMKRILWNEFFTNNRAFVDRLGLGQFNLQGDPGMPSPEEVSKLKKRRKPWSRTQNCRAMCEAIGKSTGGKLELSGDVYPTTYCEEYVVFYAGTS